jgi:hypothetical protein
LVILEFSFEISHFGVFVFLSLKDNNLNPKFNLSKIGGL